mmetsp:Transcript_9201/g.38980  ORF Transcript_9201/g.38980 Transcript_9201/m.38980 type:complete len:964 (-) Transcript_9201:1042-3933(-)
MATVNAVVERGCSMLVHFDRAASSSEIREALESGGPEAKAEAMKKAIAILLSGEQMPQIFITIVRFVLPSDDKYVQKLLLLYMEIIEKTDSSGKILPEMILICQNLRNNLQHPNEFLRGATLRFLCRITEAEILEPLIPSIVACLEHRHSFVRRNAVLCIDRIYQMPGGDMLLQDAPETIERFLAGGESDLSTRRNAFLMLYNNDQDRAVSFLLQNVEQVANWGDILQNVVLDLIRKVCRTDPSQKGKYIKIILMLLSTNNTSVIYECANTLVALSSAPTAIKAAANCYCQLLVSQSDNNVKLIVLDRLAELQRNHRYVMQEMVMDILRAVNSPNSDIRRKALDIVLDLVTARNIDEVVGALKKEIAKSQTDAGEKAGEYRQMLVQAVHACAIKFPETAGAVVHLLMDFLGDTNAAAAFDVAMFIREIAQTNASLREGIVRRLLDQFYSVRSSRVCGTCLWIIGEYSLSGTQVEEAFAVLKESLGSTPFFKKASAERVDPEEEESDGKSAAESPLREQKNAARPAVLADGTYATQTAAADVAALESGVGSLAGSLPNLRALVLGGDFFLGSVTATTLTKLALRYLSVASEPSAARRLQAETMLYIVCMLRLGKSSTLSTPIDEDSADRLSLCLKTLAAPSADPAAAEVWLRGCRDAFAGLISDKSRQAAEDAAATETAPEAQADDLIDFYHLKSRKGLSQVEIEDAVATDLARATGFAEAAASEKNRRLERVLQLTGFSDPVYAEAYVTVHQYDIVMDVTVVNRSKEVQQNLCLELATMGDLKLVERPQNYTLDVGETKHVRANIKVSSTETGVIFGNVVYETAGSDRNVVVLNDIHIDIMDYINPASCHDTAFRAMWAEFEWENKVAVNTTITDVRAFLDHVVASTNMRCLTSRSALDGECNYLAANLYAKSVFGEDALVNVSVEKQPADGKLGGYIRIRSKTQGIALSLGDKITLKQKSAE